MSACTHERAVKGSEAPVENCLVGVHSDKLAKMFYCPDCNNWSVRDPRPGYGASVPRGDGLTVGGEFWCRCPEGTCDPLSRVRTGPALNCRKLFKDSIAPPSGPGQGFASGGTDTEEPELEATITTAHYRFCPKCATGVRFKELGYGLACENCGCNTRPLGPGDKITIREVWPGVEDMHYEERQRLAERYSRDLVDALRFKPRTRVPLTGVWHEPYEPGVWGCITDSAAAVLVHDGTKGPCPKYDRIKYPSSGGFADLCDLLYVCELRQLIDSLDRQIVETTGSVRPFYDI